MHKFTSLSSYKVNGKQCFAVENPFQCEDFAHIQHHQVKIDGVRCRVIGVERFLHMPPYRKGEKIGLMTDL